MLAKNLPDFPQEAVAFRSSSARIGVMHLTGVIRRTAAPHEERQPVEVHFFHLVWLFLLCSLIGLVGETLVSYVIDGRWESRAGFVVGPLSPIYGVGAVLFTTFVNPLRGRSIPTMFAASAIVGGLFEYLAGWFFEWRYGIVAWSYADQPLNFHGHTCVGMACAWGAIGVFWVLWALPRAVAFVERMPQDMRRPLTTCAFALIMADTTCTLMALDCWFLRTSGLEPAGPVQQFFATWFGDGFMRARFETMSMWPVLAGR